MDNNIKAKPESEKTISEMLDSIIKRLDRIDEYDRQYGLQAKKEEGLEFDCLCIQPRA